MPVLSLNLLRLKFHNDYLNTNKNLNINIKSSIFMVSIESFCYIPLCLDWKAHSQSDSRYKHYGNEQFQRNHFIPACDEKSLEPPR